MTFFYYLNKKLDSIREKPEVTHGQLNERDMSRAAKGYEKYGKEGMQALAKAGREGKALDPVRAKYDKYDNDKPVDEGMGEVVKKVGGAVLNRLGHGSDKDMRQDLQRKMGMTPTGDKPDGALKYAAKTFVKHAKDPLGLKNEAGLPMTTVNGKKVPKFAADGQGANDLAKKKSFADKIAGAKKEVDEMLGDVAAEAMKSALSGGQKKLDKNNNGRLDANDFAMLRKGGKQSTAEASGAIDFDKVLDAIAALYGDDIWDNDAMQDLANDLEQAGPTDRELDFIIAKGKLPKRLASIKFSAGDNVQFGEGFDDMEKDVKNRMSARKVGDVTHGAKHDTQEIPGGRRVTRRTDPNTGYSVGADDDSSSDGEKRGRGRPKGTKGAIGAKGPSGRSKLMTREGDNESDDIKQAMAMLKKAGYKVSKAVEEESTTTRDNRAERAGRKVAKDIEYDEKKKDGIHGKKRGSEDARAEKAGKKVAKDIEYDEKKKKVKEQGGADTPTASSGFSYGKGIYDSLNRELEGMISEGMNINMSMNSDANGGPSKSLTVTATDDDAMKLSQLLKSAGLGGGNEGYGGCGDQEMDEAYGDTQPTLNEPDYPTNTETAEDNFEYAGGLNKPKSTGQTTVPVIASQEERQESYAAEEEDAIKRMMEMAGVKKKTDEEKTEEGNLFTGNLAKARADGKKEADLDGDGKMEKVDEGILASTANLWKTYKGQYGV